MFVNGVNMMRAFLLTTVLTLALTGTAHALTLKKGEVLGPDGEIYHGASPKLMEALIEKAKNGDIPAGVVGNNVYVVVGDKVSFSMFSRLESEDERIESIAAFSNLLGMRSTPSETFIIASSTSAFLLKRSINTGVSSNVFFEISYLEVRFF